MGVTNSTTGSGVELHVHLISRDLRALYEKNVKPGNLLPKVLFALEVLRQSLRGGTMK